MPRFLKVECCPECPFARTHRFSNKVTCDAEHGRILPRPFYPIGKNKFPEWCPLEKYFP